MKYLEVSVDDAFDEENQTIFDALDMGATYGGASSVSRWELEAALLSLNAGRSQAQDPWVAEIADILRAERQREEER